MQVLLWQTLRRVVGSPAPTVAAAAMLSLGIGLTTAMFSVADALLLRPVPFADADALASVYLGDQHGGRLLVAPAVFSAWRQGTAFAAVESAQGDTAIVEAGGTVVGRPMAWVTPGLFDMLGGVRPVRGRLFAPGEGRSGQDDRVLVSETVWRGLFDADPGITGRRVMIDGESVEIVGVLPATFRFPARDTAIWRAVDFDALPSNQSARLAQVYVRFSARLPRADALRVATREARAVAPDVADLQAIARPLVRATSYDRRAVPLLVGGVGFVFCVLCINVCGLLLAQFMTRRRELGISAALGASRGRLLVQALIESAMLGVGGVIGGTVLAWWLIGLARVFLPSAYFSNTLNPLVLDARAIATAITAGLVATLAAGALPAWFGARTDPMRAMHVADRASTETRASRRLSRVLLIAEVALACMLFAVATLLIRSFANMVAIDRGLNARGVMAATVSLPVDAFPDPAARLAAARQVEGKVRQLVGVTAVAWSYGLPPGGATFSFGTWTSDAAGAPGVDMTVDRYKVGPEFFALYGIPILNGRPFQESDGPQDVLISEELARRLWPGLTPLGRLFRFQKETFRTIGVVKEIRYPTVEMATERPELYEPFRELGRNAMISIRCDGGCPDAGLLRHQLLAAHPKIRVATVTRPEEAYAEQLARPRAAALLGFVFATFAFVGAIAGVYSVLSFSVGRRRREFGIRMALGASPAQVWRLVARDGLIVCLLGAGFGALGAFWLARALSGVQYGVSLTDAPTWILMIGAAIVLALVSAWQPARVAARVSPVDLLKAE